MTVLESYPIHRCIFRNDDAALKEVLSNEDIKKRINERDNHGNTPIHLALMLGRRNCIVTLINNGCDVITRNNFRWNPSEEALMMNDVDIVERINKVKYRRYMEGFIEAVKEWTKLLPNVYLKLNLKLKSSIPFFRILSTKDTAEIIKRGNSLRINTTIAGIDRRTIPKLYKGNMSIVFKYVEALDDYIVYVIDHKNKKYHEVYPNTPDFIINSALKSKIGISTLYKYFFDPSLFSVKFKKQRFLKSKRENFTLENGKVYKTDRFKVKDLIMVVRKRDNETIIGDYKSEINTNIVKIDYNKKKIEKKSSEGNSESNDDDEKTYTNKEEEEEEEEEVDFEEEEEEEDEEDDDDDDDDKDDSSSIITNNIELKPSNLPEEKVKNSIFKDLINENTVVDQKVSDEINEKVLKILNNGYDDNGNPVTEADFIYVNQFIPKYFENIIKDKLSNSDSKDVFRYLKYASVINDSNVKFDVSQDGKTKFYEMKEDYANAIKWDTVYYNKYKEMVEEENTYKLNIEKLKKELSQKKKLTEEDYFDPSNTENMHIGRIMNINEERKYFSNFVTLWLSKENEFPISLSQFRPMIHYVNAVLYDQLNIKNSDNDADRNMYIRVFKNCSKVLQSDRRFPIKICYPYNPTLKFVIRYLNCYTEEEKIPSSLFEIPEGYANDKEAIFKRFK